MIQINNLTFQYSGQPPIFENFNWQVLTGESWAVLGPSGCGKSTLLYLLAGLRYPSTGEIVVGGQTLVKPRPQTGLILQDYGLLPWATVRENASLGLRIRRFYGPDGLHAPSDVTVQDVQRPVAYWLERLGLAEVAEKFPGQISGGQRQRTAIARTLVLGPDLLLMDEPFASLDAPTRQSLGDLVRSLRQEHHLTMVIVTHAIEEAAVLGEKILVLRQPPNCRPQVIENSRASDPDFIQTPEYQAVCTELRQMLEPAQ
jgi:ABC-type nitrate/sulfonate/bicarbonate transport system ATPase subunit